MSKGHKGVGDKGKWVVIMESIHSYSEALHRFLQGVHQPTTFSETRSRCRWPKISL